MEKIKKATHQGKLNIGSFELNCAVLEDGTRVLSERSIAHAFGIRGGGAYWKRKKKGGVNLPEYLSADYLRPHIGESLIEKLRTPIPYLSIANKVSNGLEASVLPEICDFWVTLEKKGILQSEQKEIADKAYILMRGFATIGIIALVDEATGYQEIRDRTALRQILDKYLLKEYAKWAKRFPDEFYQNMFRLKGWQWKGMSVNRPSVVGIYTKDLVYSRLAPGVLAELKKLNPPDEKGVRKQRFHQWLTPDIGHPALERHLAIIIAFMKAAPNWGAFTRMVSRALPKFGETLPLPFDEINTKP